ncbi:MAG TPA: hypothetical protein VLL69_23230 [Streptosporangiaceae bacterium]|nr:hypothetical protein [Streptosporangiaceae bacterium]
MSGTPTARKPEPERPAPGPEDDSAPTPRPGERWWRKAVLRPIVLGTVGLALLLISFFLYPRTADLPSPGFARLAVSARGIQVAFVEYGVDQVSPDMAELKISVVLPARPPGRPAGAPPAFLAVAPPFGTAFRDCQPPACRVQRAGMLSSSIWAKRLTFRPVTGPGATATADFFVKARSFGITTNGISASAAIPEVLYQGSGKPILLTLYQLRSASSYDWSASPAAVVTSSTAQWQQDLASGDTPSRAAVGVNHSAQTRDDIKIFIAGALLGIAGGAIIAAVQEAMHLGD